MRSFASWFLRGVAAPAAILATSAALAFGCTTEAPAPPATEAPDAFRQCGANSHDDSSSPRRRNLSADRHGDSSSCRRRSRSADAHGDRCWRRWRSGSADGHSNGDGRASG